MIVTTGFDVEGKKVIEYLGVVRGIVVRATGIGCFFDDPVHEIVAVKGLSFQSLYHFTVGGPVEDRRLLTLPPYGHLTGAEKDRQG